MAPLSVTAAAEMMLGMLRELWRDSAGPVQMLSSARRTGRGPGRPVSAPRLDQEQGLTELDGLAVLHQHLGEAPRQLGLDLVHQLHRLDDAKDMAFLDQVPLADEGRGVGAGRPVEGG